MTARNPAPGLEAVPDPEDSSPTRGYRLAQPTLDDTDRSSIASLPPMRKDRVLITVLTGPGRGTVARVGTQDITLGRSNEADVVIPDPSLSRIHARIRCEEDGDNVSYFLEDAGSTNGTFVGETRIVDRQLLEDGVRIGLGRRTFIRFALQDQLEEQALLRVHESALHDALTGVYNRNIFDDRIATEISFTQRRKQTLALLMIDVDHFKEFNDEYGHLAGDAALRHVSSLMRQHVRAEDVLARYGGEEFAVLMRDTSPTQGFQVAERIRQSIEMARVPWEGSRLQVTISVGVSCVPGPYPATVEGLIGSADRALYAAKAQGRNRVVGALQLE